MPSNTPNQADKLEPCPFCGSKADFGTRPTEKTLWSIHCLGCSVYRVGQTREEAIAAWNTRTTHSGEGRSNGAGEDAPLGRFGHHPDPATDFCEEVTHLESIVTDKELGLRTDEDVPFDRIAKAMSFRVGGCPIAVGAKDHLREIEDRANALAALTPQGDGERLREALSDLWGIVHGCDLRLSVPMETIRKVRAALAQPEAGGE